MYNQSWNVVDEIFEPKDAFGEDCASLDHHILVEDSINDEADEIIDWWWVYHKLIIAILVLHGIHESLNIHILG